MSDSEPTDVGPEALQRESAAPGALSSTSSSHSTPRPTANFFLPAAPSANGSGKKKKPRKRGKKGTVLPSLVAAEERLLWKTRHTAPLGRHAVAKQVIEKGQRVLVEEAVVALPRQRFSSVLCHQCLRSFSEFQALERDKDVPSAFCCAECHQASPEFDPQVAAIFEDLTQIADNTNCDLDLLIFVVKLKTVQHDLLGVMNGVGGKEGQRVWWASEASTDPPMKTGWGDVRGLVRNWDKMGSDWRKSVTEACKAVRDRLKQTPRFADAELCELQELAATVNTNSHGLGSAGVENTDLALGLFPVLSMFNHSCDPNCCFLGSGTVMTVRALRDVKAGEQLTVSYLNLMEPRWLRQQILLEARYFTCACPRCSEDMHLSTDRFLEGVKCPISKCPGLLIGSETSDSTHSLWTCQECQVNFTSTHKHTGYQRPLPYAPAGGCCQQEEPRGCCPQEEPRGCCDQQELRGCCVQEEQRGCCQQEEQRGCCVQEEQQGCCQQEEKRGCCDQDCGGDADDVLPSIEKLIKAGSKAVAEFDPGAILAAAQESLSKAMEAYSKRNLLQAIRRLEHHIATFERTNLLSRNPGYYRLGCLLAALNPHHVCVFDALTPLLNCYRSFDDANSSLKVCQKTLQGFDKILKTCSMEQSNFQKILGELYRQKMHTSQTSSKSTVVRNLMKKQAQEAFRKCHEIRLVCCGPTHASTREALDALETL